MATARGDAVGCCERMRAPNFATAGRAHQLPKVTELPLSDFSAAFGRFALRSDTDALTRTFAR